MKIIFSGSGEFGLPTLKRLVDGGAEVVKVFSQPDKPAGRGKKLTPTPIASFALSTGLDVIRTASFNDEALPEADAMVVIAFGQKISQEQVNRPKFGSVNLHASILPKYRGAAPIHWAIINGESLAGNSIIRLAEKMDAGDVLAQSSLEIGAMETTGELHDRLSQDGAILMEQVLVQLRSGEAIETPQDHSQASIAPKLSRESTAIAWSDPARQICDKIRGMYPWPGCRFRLIDQTEREVARLTLVRVRALSQGRVGFAGLIDQNGHIGAADHPIEVVELQPEGKRPMSLKEFRNGHPWEAEMRLDSIV